jgi:hypothetical protein
VKLQDILAHFRPGVWATGNVVGSPSGACSKSAPTPPRIKQADARELAGLDQQKTGQTSLAARIANMVADLASSDNKPAVAPQSGVQSGTIGKFLKLGEGIFNKISNIVQPNTVQKENISTDKFLELTNFKTVECGGGGHCLLLSILHQTKDQSGKISDASALREFILGEIDKDIGKLELERKQLVGNYDQAKIDNIAKRLAHLKGLKEQSTGSQSLYDDVIYYLSKYYGKNIFVIADRQIVPEVDGENSSQMLCRLYKHDMANMDDVEHLSTDNALANKELLRGAIGIYHSSGHYKAIVSTK